MGSVPDLSHIVYRPAGCGIKFLFVHEVGLVGVQDASGKRYFYGDTIEVTIDEVSDSITHPGSGIILQVWLLRQADILKLSWIRFVTKYSVE